MNINCTRLVCTLGRNIRVECNENCRRQRIRGKKIEGDCQECNELRKELETLKAELQTRELPPVEIKEEIKETPAEEKPKRKYNKK